ncbi:MAG: hypothetical protein L3J56_11440 [Bacteroidales bacterium]|nr:hypothetical protein [Bacteroidales bacterium]
MKKNVIGILLLFSAIINVNGQVDKNNIIYKKGKICLSSSPSGGIGSNYYALKLNIKPGYFIVNNLLFAVEFGGTLSNERIQRNVYFKPSIEYFVLNRKITPVIRTGYIFENRFNYNTFYSSLFAGAGVHFAFGKNNAFGIYAGIDYYFKNDRFVSGIMPYVSLGYYFGRKQKEKKKLY